MPAETKLARRKKAARKVAEIMYASLQQFSEDEQERRIKEIHKIAAKAGAKLSRKPSKRPQLISFSFVRLLHLWGRARLPSAFLPELLRVLQGQSRQFLLLHPAVPFLFSLGMGYRSLFVLSSAKGNSALTNG